MDEAAEFGLRQGLCVPIHGPFPPAGAVAFAGECIDVPPHAEIALEALASHAMHAALKLARKGSETKPTLSGREQEVLQWMAKGKTAWETSRILGISNHTVATHLRNAQQKLGTANTTHTAVVAVHRGEIRL